MEPNTINQFPPNQPLDAESSKSYGAIVASVIIILILVVGGLYFWGKTLSERQQVPPTPQEQTTNAGATNDSVSSLDTDLNVSGGDINNVNTDLKGI